MMPTQHPDYGLVWETVQELKRLAKPLYGFGYRSVSPQYASKENLLSGVGSQHAGGRWNPKGSFETVYLSDSPETALRESLAYSRSLKIPDYQMLPRIIVGVKIRVARVLNVTDEKVAAVLLPFLEKDDLVWRKAQDVHETASQAIGRAAKESCLRGLMVPSHVNERAMNFVLFVRKLRSKDVLEVMHPKPLS